MKKKINKINDDQKKKSHKKNIAQLQKMAYLCVYVFVYVRVCVSGCISRILLENKNCMQSQFRPMANCLNFF